MRYGHEGALLARGAARGRPENEGHALGIAVIQWRQRQDVHDAERRGVDANAAADSVRPAAAVNPGARRIRRRP